MNAAPAVARVGTVAAAALAIAAVSTASVAFGACAREAPSAHDDGRDARAPRSDEIARAPSLEASSSAAPASTVASDAAPPPSLHRDRGGAEAYVTAAPVSGKSIGHTSVVFKLKLDGGLEGAFKPRSRRGKDRYRGEVAAYRLARALRLGNVPPAYPRVVEHNALLAALGGKTTAAGKLLAAEALADADGKLPGAIVPWLPNFELLPLESPAWRARLRGWLARGTGIAVEDRRLAAQASTMIVFDYVTGNWDRWSGGNVAIDRTSGTVLFIDNDGAFFESPPAAATATQLGLIRATFKFSRAFVRALEQLAASALGDAVGEEAPGTPLLPPKVLASVDARRRAVLAIIAAKIAADGEAAVLAFD